MFAHHAPAGQAGSCPGWRDRLSYGFSKLGQSNAPAATFAVFGWFVTYADEDGWSWPSAATIAQRTGYSVRHVKRAISMLRGLGLLEPVAQKAGVAVKFLVSPGAVRGCFATGAKRPTSDTHVTKPVTPMSPVDARTSDTHVTGQEATGDTHVTGPVTPMSPEQYREQVPPQPPQGGTGLAPLEPRPAPAPAGRPQRQPNPDDATPLPAEAIAVDSMFERLRRLGKIDREFAVRGALAAMVKAGGKLEDLNLLISAAEGERDGQRRSRSDMIGLTVSWASSGQWRDVVDDVLEHRKVATHRKAASIRDIDGTPAPLRALMAQA